MFAKKRKKKQRKKKRQNTSELENKAFRTSVELVAPPEVDEDDNPRLLLVSFTERKFTFSETLLILKTKLYKSLFRGSVAEWLDP